MNQANNKHSVRVKKNRRPLYSNGKTIKKLLSKISSHSPSTSRYKNGLEQL